MITASQILIAVGAFSCLGTLYRFSRFIWVYCLRPSSIGTYLHGPAPYVLVTGASDGIGKTVAKALYDQGFNLILHGRSEEKMREVADELRTRGSRDVKYFLAPAEQSNLDYAGLVEPFKGLNITFVVNNVGGLSNRMGRIDEYSEEELSGDLHLNMLFAFYLTRALLPTLRVSAPAQVLFVGSQGAELSIPRHFTYGTSKSFLKDLARCLSCDERWWTPSNVSFVYVTVGTVVTNSMRTTPHILNPTADRFAQALMARIGCADDEYSPWMPHTMQLWLMKKLGVGLIEMYAAPVIKGILEKKAAEAEADRKRS